MYTKCVCWVYIRFTSASLSSPCSVCVCSLSMCRAEHGTPMVRNEETTHAEEEKMDAGDVSVCLCMARVRNRDCIYHRVYFRLARVFMPSSAAMYHAWCRAESHTRAYVCVYVRITNGMKMNAGTNKRKIKTKSWSVFMCRSCGFGRWTKELVWIYRICARYSCSNWLKTDDVSTLLGIMMGFDTNGIRHYDQRWKNSKLRSVRSIHYSITIFGVSNTFGCSINALGCWFHSAESISAHIRHIHMANVCNK